MQCDLLFKNKCTCADKGIMFDFLECFFHFCKTPKDPHPSLKKSSSSTQKEKVPNRALGSPNSLFFFFFSFILFELKWRRRMMW
jgi:hypothetical protein